MNIITGRTGQPHVTSQQQRDTNAAVFGSNNCVLNVGKCLKAERVNANTIRIYDGQLSMQGCIASIEANEYEDVTIENGTIGKQRYDLIAAHYVKIQDIDGQYIEDVQLNVISGAESESTYVMPKAQAVANERNIRDGAVEYDFPLYKVHIQGLDIVSIEPLFSVANYDTGWVTISLSSDFKNYYSNRQLLKYRRIGNDVEIDGDITPTKPLDFKSDFEKAFKIGHLPDDCIPTDGVRVLCQGPGLCSWLLNITNAGDLMVARSREGSAWLNLEPPYWMTLHARYFVG